MPYAEYPKTDYYDQDLGELIGFYKKVASEYAGTLDAITKVNERLTKYQSELPKYTQLLVDNAIKQYAKDCENIAKTLTVAIEQVKASVVDEATKRGLEDEKLLAEIRAVSMKVNDTEKKFDRRISELRLMLLASDSANRKIVDNAVKYLENRLEQLPKSTYPLYNPIRNELDSVNHTVLDMYNHGLTTNGFSAGQWHTETHITCQFFKDSDIECLEFYTDGKPLLGSYKNRHMVFSPVTGKYVLIEKALAELTEYVKTFAITATGYDDTELTAKTYDDKNVSAENYDFNGKGVLTDV